MDINNPDVIERDNTNVALLTGRVDVNVVRRSSF